MVLAGATIACAGILGIEDARCDSDFDPECRRVSGGDTGGTFGNGGVSGMTSGGSSGAAGALTPAGSSGSAGVSPMGGASGSAAMGISLCEEYCDTVEANCIEAYQQYASRNSCLAVCSLLEPGQRGTMTGNTVHCRLTRAQLADNTGEPRDYCFSAGPGGAGVCGADCDGYCALMTAKCSDFDSMADCLDACADVPSLSAPPDRTFNTTFQSGDSLQCRLFHVSAATIDPVFHCEHAAGLSICAPP